MRPMFGEVQWGNVGTWVGALAAASAFIVTASLLVLQYRDRVREQARLVSAWLEDISFVSNETGTRRQALVRFRNGSGEPV
jgi:hypothetical protein